MKTKKRLFSFASTCGFVIKRLHNLKKCLKKRRGELKKKPKLFSLKYIWRQDVSLQWCKGSKSFLPGRFGYPYGRPGDPYRIRETPGLSGRVGMYAILPVTFNCFPLGNLTLNREHRNQTLHLFYAGFRYFLSVFLVSVLLFTALLERAFVLYQKPVGL